MAAIADLATGEGPNNVTSKPYTAEATSSANRWFVLNKDRIYTLKSNGIDSTGAASTADVFYGFEADPAAADYSASSNKGVLRPNEAVDVGPNVQLLYVKTASTAQGITITPGEQAKWRN